MPNPPRNYTHAKVDLDSIKIYNTTTASRAFMKWLSNQSKKGRELMISVSQPDDSKYFKVTLAEVDLTTSDNIDIFSLTTEQYQNVADEINNS